MKKSILILLMLVYSLSSVGMTVSLHYCCGKLDGISFTGKQKTTCPMCGKDESSSCCKDTVVKVKLPADQQASVKVFTPEKASLILPQLQYFDAAFIPLATSFLKGSVGNTPPSPVPIFIRNCVFIV